MNQDFRLSHNTQMPPNIRDRVKYRSQQLTEIIMKFEKPIQQLQGFWLSAVVYLNRYRDMWLAPGRYVTRSAVRERKCVALRRIMVHVSNICKNMTLNIEFNYVSKVTVHVSNICKNITFKYRIKSCQ